MYILDIIKDDYKTKWKSGDKILINAPTGSGKSTFLEMLFLLIVKKII